MITLSRGEIPEIEWERGEFIEKHDGCREYACAGDSLDGREWIATWWQTGDEVDIENIEKA